MDRLLLVRHGETAWNSGKVLQGQSDIVLSDAGRRQVSALQSIVAQWKPSVVVSSDLLRAKETAALLGYATPEIDSRWREADLGQWTGQSAELLKHEHATQYQAWRDGTQTPPGGESFADLKRRVATAISALSVHTGTVMVVTHGGTIRAALSHLIQLEPNRLIAVEPASATLLQIKPNARLQAFNVCAAGTRVETSE
jgi:glucosyl-3-phosphoglycerate phosphatase